MLEAHTSVPRQVAPMRHATQSARQEREVRAAHSPRPYGRAAKILIVIQVLDEAVCTHESAGVPSFASRSLPENT